MKHFLPIWLMVSALLVALCPSCTDVDEQRYQAGVSRPLAQWRKQQIKDLHYQLQFKIPKAKETPIMGVVTVSFRLDEPQEVILDFRETDDKVQSVSVNALTTPYTLRNEHLIIPKESMEAGINEVRIHFFAGEQSLNRHDDLLYTLLVPDRARTLFPCFDQPDLKATFVLQLELPEEWQAVSNTYILHEESILGRKVLHFAPTEPLSTYLFSFVAGKLQRREFTDGERTIAAYFRETDPRKLAQLDTIFRQVTASLEWMETYTGVPYPFAKYDFVILPGFQYGGMEHTGATLYNDTQLFLGEHPTPDEELRRAQLIAHETAHMWFGDLVTMQWFDDVWTKEVFANYYAACITEPLFPDINHSLLWMKTYTAAALSEDRTPGTTAIRQPLDNLQDAGLIYGQIIYNKAPVVMKKMVEMMGEEPFREGIREYLQTYAYGNATWEDLIQILDAKTDHDLAAFSEVWVHQKGMPHITFETQGDQLTIRQHDPYHRGLLWPQRFALTLCGARDSALCGARDTTLEVSLTDSVQRLTLCGARDTTLEVSLTDSVQRLTLPFAPTAVLPNTDGRGYGLFTPDPQSLDYLLHHWQQAPDETAHQAWLMLLYENYQAKQLTSAVWIAALLDGLRQETNALTASTLVSYLPQPLRELSEAERDEAEQALLSLSASHPLPSCRTQLLRCLFTEGRSPALVRQFRQLWQEQSDPRLNESDYTTLAYELSLRLPAESATILATQRSRISHPDRLRQFDFISRAMTPDTLQLDELFRLLLQADNRQVEPWAATTLAYLHHPLREAYSVKYIRPALEELAEVQRTGDIFFPRNWVGALLRNHSSEAAFRAVKAFLDDHPDYPPLLKNKILQAAHPLYRRYS